MLFVRIYDCQRAWGSDAAALIAHYSNRWPAGDVVERDAHREALRREFIYGFLRPDSADPVISNPDGRATVDSTIEAQVRRAGRDRRRAHPDSIKETLEALGYVETKAEGTWWSDGFEYSGFRPLHENSILLLNGWLIWPQEDVAADIWGSDGAQPPCAPSSRASHRLLESTPVGMVTWVLTAICSLRPTSRESASRRSFCCHRHAWR
jgi:hypothetical protein